MGKKSIGLWALGRLAAIQIEPTDKVHMEQNVRQKHLGNQ